MLDGNILDVTDVTVYNPLLLEETHIMVAAVAAE